MRMELVEVGHVRKTHGYRGEVKLLVNEGYEDDVEEAEFLFIGRSPERALPYEVVELRGNDWIVALDGVADREAAAELRGQTLFLRAAEVNGAPPPAPGAPDAGEVERYRRFVGFQAIDEALGPIGIINEVVTYPSQVMAEVEYRSRSVLVPLNAHFIRGVDFTRRLVNFDLPEGLLEL